MILCIARYFFYFYFCNQNKKTASLKQTEQKNDKNYIHSKAK